MRRTKDSLPGRWAERSRMQSDKGRPVSLATARSKRRYAENPSILLAWSTAGPAFDCPPECSPASLCWLSRLHPQPIMAARTRPLGWVKEPATVRQALWVACAKPIEAATHRTSAKRINAWTPRTRRIPRSKTTGPRISRARNLSPTRPKFRRTRRKKAPTKPRPAAMVVVPDAKTTKNAQTSTVLALKANAEITFVWRSHSPTRAPAQTLPLAFPAASVIAANARAPVADCSSSTSTRVPRNGKPRPKTELRPAGRSPWQRLANVTNPSVEKTPPRITALVLSIKSRAPKSAAVCPAASPGTGIVFYRRRSISRSSMATSSSAIGDIYILRPTASRVVAARNTRCMQSSTVSARLLSSKATTTASTTSPGPAKAMCSARAGDPWRSRFA